MSGGDITFFPPEASNFASRVDVLFAFEMAVAAFFTGLIFVAILIFCIRFRRRSEDEVPPKVPSHYGLELMWTAIPFGLMLIMFFWGAWLYLQMKRPGENGLEIHVIGKQWMWKIEHPEGVREIDELHIPVNVPVKLILASQDVIHDFFVPAFRVKQDVVPGSYVTEWFEPTKVGSYRLFCSQFCGMGHSTMVGKVIVMNQHDYQAWLAGAMPGESPAVSGKLLFTSLGCVQCHGQRGPNLAGLYGSRVALNDGSTVIADEQYIRDSITDPSKQIVAGFPPIMPAFRGQLSEEQLFDLVSYVKSLETVRNLPDDNVSQRPAPDLNAPSTRPAPGNQPAVMPDFPPAERMTVPPTEQEPPRP